MKSEVEMIAEAVRGAVDERKRRRRSPSLDRSSRLARGKRPSEFQLSVEVVEMLKVRHERTGESRSAIVEAALRAFLAASLATLLSACGPAPSDEPSVAPARCAVRTSQPSQLRYARTSGTCYADPERTLLMVPGQPEAGPLGGPCSGTVSYSDDNCVQAYELTCPLGRVSEPETLSISGTAAWSEDGLSGTAVEEWTARAGDGSVLCAATFDVVVVPR